MTISGFASTPRRIILNAGNQNHRLRRFHRKDSGSSESVERQYNSKRGKRGIAKPRVEVAQRRKTLCYKKTRKLNRLFDSEENLFGP